MTRSPEFYSGLTRLVIGFVFLLLILVPAYFFLPTGVADTRLTHETLLICDFKVLHSGFAAGTTILEVQSDTGPLNLVLSRNLYRPDLTAAIVTCDNARLLAISPLSSEGMSVITGNYVQLLTTTGDAVTFLAIDSIHQPFWYQSVFYDQRALIGPLILVLIWLDSVLIFDSLSRMLRGWKERRRNLSHEKR
jgi:hypothetical protein